MKKIILAVLFACMMAVGVQAQVFIGGSLGVDYSADKYSSGSVSVNEPAYTGFEFSPMVGFYLTDNLAIGAQINLGIFNVNDRDDKPTKFTATTFGVAPFIRTTFVSAGNLSLVLETSVGFNSVSTKSNYESVTVDGPSATIIGLNAVPLLSYKMSDRLSIEMRTNLLRLSGGSAAVKEKYGSTEYTTTTTYFGFGVNPSGISSLIMNELEMSFVGGSPLQIGMIFKF